MKESNWGYGIVSLGVMIIAVIALVQDITTTKEEDFYLGREVLSASMIDAVDMGSYRSSGKLVMSKEKFVEVFLRRFAESVSSNKTYQIDFYDIREYPPKASVRVKTLSNEASIGHDTDSFSVSIDTLLSGVLETVLDVKQYSDASAGLYYFDEPSVGGLITPPTVDSSGVTSTEGKYKVTLNANGGSNFNGLNEIFVDKNNRLDEPNDPTKSNYDFLGWYTSNKTLFDFNKPITSDITLYALWVSSLNYTHNNSGNWFFINNPQKLNDSYLADNNKEIYKSVLNGTNEIYYYHGVDSDSVGKYYYGIRLYNDNNSEATVTINKCGAINGYDDLKLWKMYYGKETCNLNNFFNSGSGKSNKVITIPPQGMVVLYHNGNGFTAMKKNDIKVTIDGVPYSVNKVNTDAFQGVLNVTTNQNIKFAALWLENPSSTLNANYSSNVTENDAARSYSGEVNYLPILNADINFDIYPQTPSGVLPIKYKAANGNYYVADGTHNDVRWRTNFVGAYVDSSNGYNIVQNDKHYVGDIINLEVPFSGSSKTTIGAYPLYKESRDIMHSSGNSIKNWPYNIANWGVRYNEKIIINNHDNKDRVVSFWLKDLTNKQNVIVNYNSTVQELNIFGDKKIWNVTVPGGSKYETSVEFILSGNSTGGLTRELILQ